MPTTYHANAEQKVKDIAAEYERKLRELSEATALLRKHNDVQTVDVEDANASVHEHLSKKTRRDVFLFFAQLIVGVALTEFVDSMTRLDPNGKLLAEPKTIAFWVFVLLASGIASAVTLFK